MRIKGLVGTIFLVTMVLLAAPGLRAQITAPGSSFSEETSYPVTSGNDPIFIFCSGEGETNALLRASFAGEGARSWEWQKYNPANGEFGFYFSENTSNPTSEIRSLEDGLYQVNITAGGTAVSYRAWVFNNHNPVEADITESNCQYFTLQAIPVVTTLVYYDPQTGAPVELNKNLQLEWRQGDEVISRQAVRQLFDPPTKDTEYTLVVSDRFGCETVKKVTYRSIVTKAAFTADPMNGEAPLIVTFKNTSENGTSGQYEWFFFRDLDEIKRESEKSTLEIDSIMETAINDELAYTYEWSGTYMVKLVSKKMITGDLFTSDPDLRFCADTAYLEDYIIADTSFVDVPNVFTPNGDGTNDQFVVKFWSMEKVKITIVNRWGRAVHVWESSNVRGFRDTWMESVWDGRIGSRLASPGVYYYVIEGTGRDGKKRWKHGDVYLIRGKE